MRNEHADKMIWSKLRAQIDSNYPDINPIESRIGIDFTFGDKLSKYLNKIRKKDIELYKQFALSKKDFNLFKEKVWERIFKSTAYLKVNSTKLV